MSDAHTRTVRLYRLWRTSSVLLALGAAEFGFLAWQRSLPWLWLMALGLVVGAAAGTRRAAALRRRLYDQA